MRIIMPDLLIEMWWIRKVSYQHLFEFSLCDLPILTLLQPILRGGAAGALAVGRCAERLMAADADAVGGGAAAVYPG